MPCKSKTKPSRLPWLVRSHRDELMRAGELARVGQLVVLGAPSSRWIQRQADALHGYRVAANDQQGDRQEGAS